MLDKFPNGNLGNQKKISVRKKRRERNPDAAAVCGNVSPVGQLSGKHRGVGHQGQRKNLDVDGNVGGILKGYQLILRENLQPQTCLKIPLHVSAHW